MLKWYQNAALSYLYLDDVSCEPGGELSIAIYYIWIIVLEI